MLCGMETGSLEGQETLRELLKALAFEHLRLDRGVEHLSAQLQEPGAMAAFVATIHATSV